MDYGKRLGKTIASELAKLQREWASACRSHMSLDMAQWTFSTLFILFATAAAVGGCSDGSSSGSGGAGGLAAIGGSTATGGNGSAMGGNLDAGELDDGGLPVITPGKTDSRAFGSFDVTTFAFAAFSQVPTNLTDPQVLDLAPNLVPRAWQRWDNWGAHPSDYDFSYPAQCHAKGTTMLGGTTASALFPDEVSPAEFSDEVSRDASGNPVAHPELNSITANAYRGSLGSPAYRKRLLYLTEFQIDGGVDGVHFDEVLGGYTGANWVGGNEGFDDYQVADFGVYLCQKYAGSLSILTGQLGVTTDDKLDCAGSSGGRDFDYRGYLARHGAQNAPLGAKNPLAADWGTTTNNRPDPTKRTFLETYPTLVYWQQIVVALRTYAREKYGREILISANGFFPYVDFHTVGLYDGNIDGPGGSNFDWVPIKGTDLDGTVTFKAVFENFRARAQQIADAVGGNAAPIVVFLDWPTASIDRYYALPIQSRKDYFRLYAAEAHALGMRFAVPLATTTDEHTATALGMMDFFKQLRDFYQSHDQQFRNPRELPDVPTVSVPNVTTILNRIADGSTVLHIVNHAYSGGVVTQPGVTASFPLAAAPTSVTLISPDFTNDKAADFTYTSGMLTVTVGELQAYVAVVAQ